MRRFAYPILACMSSIALMPPCLALNPTAKNADNLKRFAKATDGWKVVNDPLVKKCMKAAMGNAVDRYFDNTQLLETPKVTGDDLVVTGGVRGLFTITESVLSLNLRNNTACVGLLDDNKIDIYGAQTTAALPKAVKDYIRDLEKRKAEKVTVSFLKPDTKPVKKAASAKRQPVKALNIENLTGTYQRDDSSQFDSSDLAVELLKDGKIKFQIEAMSGSHTGEATGEAAVKNGIATFTDKISDNCSYTLTMKFKGKYVEVTQDGEGFGGMGVTADGKYVKTDDSKPNFR